MASVGLGRQRAALNTRDDGHTAVQPCAIHFFLLAAVRDHGVQGSAEHETLIEIGRVVGLGVEDGLARDRPV